MAQVLAGAGPEKREKIERKNFQGRVPKELSITFLAAVQTVFENRNY